MRKKELIQIIMLISSNYQVNDDKVKNMVNMWYAFFKNDDAKKMLDAVMEHIAESKFVPTVADIKERMNKPTAFSDNCYDTLAAERLSRGLQERISVR